MEIAAHLSSGLSSPTIQFPPWMLEKGSSSQLSQDQEAPQIKLNTEHSRTLPDEICFFFYFLSSTLSIEKNI